MCVVTRKQSYLAAQNAPLQAGKRVKTPADLEALFALVVMNPALGAFVDTLDVTLRTAFSMAALRKTLALMPNLTDLILVVPGLRSLALLRGVRLPQLQYLRTDLPHDLLLDFLSSHPTIVDLDLVGRAHVSTPACPLQHARLDFLHCLSGPGSCVSHFAPPGLTRLMMTRDTSIFAATLWLRAMPTPFPTLYQLTIDVCGNDIDILACITRACPALRKLKILEQKSSGRRGPSNRRSWNDGSAWARSLKKLPHLEELLLSTAAPLVRHAGDLRLERKVILTWVYGRGGTRRTASAKPHPMLYHVGVWYGTGRLDDGCITHWSKPSGVWQRTVTLVGPPPGFSFI